MKRGVKIMKSLFYSVLWLCLCAVSGYTLTEESSGGLNRDRIRTNYNDGNFEVVEAEIMEFIKANPQYNRDDSIFVCKHLSVVYTSNPETREKGKYYMHLLLRLMPAADLVDMYVSDEIDRIFEKIRQEFVSRNQPAGTSAQTAAAEPAQKPAPEPVKTRRAVSAPAQESEPAEKPEKKSGSTTKYWVAGGTAAAAAVLIAVLVLSADEPENPNRTEYVITEEPE